jgi:hypothetical protein
MSAALAGWRFAQRVTRVAVLVGRTLTGSRLRSRRRSSASAAALG